MSYKFEMLYDKNILEGIFSNKIENGIEYIQFQLTSKQMIDFPQVILKIWDFPIIENHFTWEPTMFRNKQHKMCWGENDRGNSVKGTVSAPVTSYFSNDGTNKLTVAFSEVEETILFKAGILEENATAIIKIELFSQKTKKRDFYSGTIRIDTRNIKFEKALNDVANWYDTKYIPMQTVEISKRPMYSTWYNFHQMITAKEIEEECKIAKTLGMDSVIVDDGWQTDDNNRGYAYCGDWEAAPKKMGNMATHVEMIHRLGMKYILWYSVPFIGKYSKVCEKYKNMTLYYIEDLETYVLDPRYKEVRDYLINIYKTAVSDWKLDGLKLDFIDCFDIKNADENAMKDSLNRDFDSVQEAVGNLMIEIKQELLKINPEIMIEFRQRYIGPFIRQFGNILRVADCPLDYVANRNGIVDLKMLSGNTAIHSDMMMWNKSDTVESAALQILNVLYGVPQVSVKLKEIPKAHFDMVAHWLKFWNENREILLSSDWNASSVEYNNLWIETRLLGKAIRTIFSDIVIEVEKIEKELILINAKSTSNFIISVEKKIFCRVDVYDTLGNLISKEKLELVGINKLEVPKSGYIKFIV